MGELISPLERDMLTEEGFAVLELVRDLIRNELDPNVGEYERAGRFPREIFVTLGRAGLLSLPYSDRFGGGGQPYQVYLQVLEELARSWVAIAVGVSVHTLSCFPLANFGSEQQQNNWLPSMLSGEQLGAYCLSEPQSGSDAAALTTNAKYQDGTYLVNGVKAWVTHAGVADYYNMMIRTGETGPHGISCFLIPATTSGVLPQQPEHKMGLASSPTAQIVLENASVSKDRLIGELGQGFSIALSALDSGRLGIAACAIGLAQAALDYATEYAKTREQFGRPILEFQGTSFLLADMATNIAAGRALYLAAARRRDAGKPFTTAAAQAKLYCTDVAMKATVDAVQILGGAGYVEDHPVERYLREAKVLQIVEGTNQIQRLVISRDLGKGSILTGQD